MADKPIGERVRRALLRARVRQRLRNRRRLSGRLLTGVVCLLAGLMITVSAINARGIDLRPARNTDLVSLVESQSQRNADLTRQAQRLRTEVDQLAARESSTAPSAQVGALSAAAGLTAVTGPALTVTLDDAPADVTAPNIDQDLLVVHQQDIESIVNLLWAGGAEAMTIQGQRVIATTGIKCVGNTVVLHGVPYAPPYKISAIGDQQKLRRTLDRSNFVRIYRQYVDAFRLGYQVQYTAHAHFPAYRGALDLQYAHPGAGK